MILAANWKAYIEDLTKAKKLYATGKRLSRRANLSIILAPPTAFLGVLAASNRSAVAFSAQDVSETTGGAHTGETTAQAVAAVGATYTIVGHSERRAAGDTNAIVANKTAHALAHNVLPILCIGESTRDEDARYLSIVREQLSTVLEPLSQKERSRLIFAYEPVWAIGKTAGDAIRSADLSEMLLYIRKVLSDYLPGKNASRAVILYGGSVEPGNARDLARDTDVNGFLVGHAATDSATFVALADALS